MPQESKRPAGPDGLAKTEPAPSAKRLDETQPQGDTDPRSETAAPAAPATKPAPSGQADSTPQAGEAKTNQLGDFKLLKKLGEGGMGAVFKAHQVSLDRPVALKVLPKRLATNESFVQRFYREARIAAKLDHPNVVRGYHVGEDKGFHYLAMEFVDGGSIQDLLQKHQRFSIGDALHVTLACARALQHAHEQNLIHRDVKPDNLLLTKKGVVKLADLGLAKALDDDLSLTQSGVGAGTPYYMAPEQARDAKNVDGRSDIYALGCMLYVFLVGETPFKGTTTLEVVKAKEEGKFTPARRFNPEIPDRLDLIIDKMLAKKPEHRYQTCAEVIKDLEELGLANPTLSILGPASASSGPVPAAAQTATGKPDATRPTKASPPLAASKAAATTEEESPDRWYVKYRTADGQPHLRKMTTIQITELIKDPSFDVRAEASRTRDGTYRNLGSYKEFEHALRSRLTQAKAKRKAEKFQSFYDKIEQEDRSRRRWRWLRDLFRGTVGWITLLIFVAALLAIFYLIWKTDVFGAMGQWIRAKLGL